MRALVATLLVAASSVPAEGAPRASRDEVAPWSFAAPFSTTAVFQIAADPRGRVWVASALGLQRWDGAGVVTVAQPSDFELPSSYVYAVLPRASGEILAGGAGGARLCRSGAAPCPGELPGSPGLVAVDEAAAPGRAARPRLAGLPSDRVTALAEVEGQLWIGTDAGLGKATTPDGPLPARTFAHVPLPGAGPRPSIDGLFATTPGALLVASNEGLWRLRGSEAPARLLAEPVRAVVEDARGAVWAATSAGVVVLEGGGARRLGPREGLAGADVRALAIDDEGGVWIGTSSGLSRVDADGQVTTFDARRLPDPRVLALAADREGGVWIGLRAGGVLRATRTLVQNFGAAEGLPSDYISVTTAEDGTVWAAARDGTLWRRRPGKGATFAAVPLPSPLGAGPLGAMAAARDGAVWVAARGGGIARFDGTAWRRASLAGRRRPGSADDAWQDDVTLLHADRRGRLWLGGRGGQLSAYDVEAAGDGGAPELARRETFDAAAGTCPAPAVQVAEDDAARLWVATAGAGLTLIDGGRARCLAERNVPRALSSVAVDETGVVWAGSTEGALLRVRDGRARAFSETDGLPCDAITGVVPDRRGHLWITCGAGAARLDLSSLAAIGAGRRGRLAALTFNRLAGMRAEETNPGAHPAAALEGTERLWVATSAGLAALVDPDLVPPPPPPTPRVSAVLVDGRPGPTDVVRARGRRVRVDVRFAAAGLGGAQPISFRHRLVGHDTRWQADGAQAGATYALAPGDYRLEVLTASPFGSWSATPAVLEVHVLPAVSQRPWFWGLLAASGAAAWAASQRFRQARLAARHRALQDERARIARDLHDGLGQGFTSVRFHLEALGEALDQARDARADAARALVPRLRSLLARIEDEARRAVWDLRERGFGAAGLPEALRALVGEVSTAASAAAARVTLVTEGALAEVDALVERELLQVAREALTNALRHGAARAIEVRLEGDADELRLLVHDDGRGFVVDEGDPVAAGHFGILGMRERLRRLGGALVVDSAPGEGTTVLAAVPLRRRAGTPEEVRG